MSGTAFNKVLFGTRRRPHEGLHWLCRAARIKVFAYSHRAISDSVLDPVGGTCEEGSSNWRGPIWFPINMLRLIQLLGATSEEAILAEGKIAAQSVR